MKVNCIHCGHGFGVDDSYCDYEGLIRCSTCSGLLDVRFEDGLIKAVRPGSLSMPAPQPATQHAEGSVEPEAVALGEDGHRGVGEDVQSEQKNAA